MYKFEAINVSFICSLKVRVKSETPERLTEEKKKVVPQKFVRKLKAFFLYTFYLFKSNISPYRPLLIDFE